MFKELLINEQIRVGSVRLIGTDGTPQGIMPTEQALAIAEEAGLDLVLINASANPAVCKILDYPKYKYDAIKKEKELKKNQKVQEVKEIQLSMRINDYHTAFKIKNAQKFLQDGDKVKVVLRMRGRECAKSAQAVEMVNDFVDKVAQFGTVDKPPVVMGRFVNVVINPKKQ